jgi:hypothetical protein
MSERKARPQYLVFVFFLARFFTQPDFGMTHLAFLIKSMEGNWIKGYTIVEFGGCGRVIGHTKRP